MLVRVFKNNNPAFFLAIFLIAILMWIPSLFGHHESNYVNNSFIFEGINFFVVQNPTLIILINFSVLFVLGIILTNINTKFIIIEHRNFLTALFFLILASSFKETQVVLSTSISTVLFISSVYLILNSYKKKKAIKEIFIAALLIGLATLMMPAYIYLIFIIFVGLALLRPIYIREWISVLWGFILPFAIYFGIAFLKDDNLEIIRSYFMSNIYSEFHLFKNLNNLNLIFLTIYFFFIIASSYYILFRSPILKVRNKNYFKFFFYIFAVIFISTMINSQFFYAYFVLTALPISFLQSYMFNESRNKIIADVFFILLLLSSFFNIYGEKIIPN